MAQNDATLFGRLRWLLKTTRDVMYLPRLARDKSALDGIVHPDELIDFLCTRPRRRGTIRANQNVFEISNLYEIVVAKRPEVVVEIGTSKGGTLYLWSRAAAAGATLISIDLPGGCGTVTRGHRRVYQSFGDHRGIQTHTLACDSHADAARAEVRAILGGRKVDFLFIDGDHSYEGVKADFFDYARLMHADGLIAMHDIAIPETHPTITVGRFWKELEGGKFDIEAIVDPDRESPGIGVVALETSPQITEDLRPAA
jgi:cephalosporin hydroxylase